MPELDLMWILSFLLFFIFRIVFEEFAIVLISSLLKFVMMFEIKFLDKIIYLCNRLLLKNLF